MTEIPESYSNSISVTCSNFLEFLSIPTDLVFEHYDIRRFRYDTKPAEKEVLFEIETLGSV